MSPIANMLISLKNAQAVGHQTVVVPFSRMKFDIATVLQEKGFVQSVEKKKKRGRKIELPYLAINLKYNGNEGAITGMKFISKPSRKMYVGKTDLHQVRSGYGISVVSTSKGVMAGEDAKKAGVGGELLFEIW